MHRLFTVFAFLSVENMEPDELHIFHLGVSGYVLGSILYLLVYVLLVGSPHDNLNRVWQAILNHYNAHDTASQYTNMQLSLVREHQGRSLDLS